MFNRKRSESFGKNNVKWKKLDELILPNAKLRFCAEQLQNLNVIFNKKVQEKCELATEKSLLLARSVTERLVQRLLCSVGIIDPSFSSKFLICNHEQKNNTLPLNLKYLVRLDSLSTPCIYKEEPDVKFSVHETDSDYPAAYARIRLHTPSFKEWGDYANANGYLRRDKMQARFVELLAQAASKELPFSPLQVDESCLCGIPGKILDPATLYHLLKIPCTQQVFYGPGGNIPRFPDPRDVKLAIVDEPSGIKLKIEFLSPALSNITVTVRLLVAIGIDAWPSSSNFPGRISLGHTDCLLYHQAAQTGMYLVGYGVQSSAWQIRVPAAEYVLMNHYGPTSTVKTVLDILYETMDEIDISRKFKKQECYKILNRYIFLTLLLEELEESSTNPSTDIINWSPLYLSTIVLKLLDKIIPKLYNENQSSYFFKKANLLVNPGHLSDHDYVIEANNVKAYMNKLFDESLLTIRGNEDLKKVILAQESELVLLYRWKDLINGLLPPSGTRGRRFCFAGSKNRQEVVHTQYTTRQLDYTGLLLKNMLKVQQKILRSDVFSKTTTAKSEVLDNDNHLEDVIFILVTIMDQARDQYLLKQTNPNVARNRSKIRGQFNNYTSKLVELIRKDKEISHLNFEDDTVIVKIILKWLYKAMDQNKRYLAPILRPYLNNLFATSHELSWQIDAINQRENNDELNALGIYAELVNSGQITPAEGLIDAVNKNWNWAKNMLDMVQKNTLRLVFISGRGNVYRHILSLPSYQRKSSWDDSVSFDRIEKPSCTIKRQKTMPNRNYFDSILKEKNEKTENNSIPQHDNLKKFTPLTYVLSFKHRRGEHRGCGDILKTLMSMQKLNVFQEVTNTLPSEERTEISHLIQTLQNMKTKKSAARKWSSTLPALHHRSRVNPSGEFIPKYTPKEESAGVRVAESKNLKETNSKEIKINKVDLNSLLGTSKAARIKEDSSNVFLLQDLKIKSLINRSESLKY